MPDPKHRGGAIVRPADSVPSTEIPAGREASVQVLLGEAEGMPHFAMRRFRMAKGGGIPLHHNEVEHEQYVLRGRARLTLGERQVEVGPGDVLYIPAGLVHDYRVLEGPFEFLCLVPNLPDRLHFVDES